MYELLKKKDMLESGVVMQLQRTSKVGNSDPFLTLSHPPQGGLILFRKDVLTTA
jgi:hypothetical protein